MLELATIRVSGADASDFLQGQLTNDVRRLDAEDEILAAWCSPKGRVLWFGTVVATDTGFALSALAEIADDIVRRLAVFRFRARVEFEVVADGQTADPAVLVDTGYPWVGSAQMEQFTPHMLNLDLLDAVSLDKGCYTGQEIVARTHYKGATRRRTLKFACDRPVGSGEKLTAAGRNVGEVLNVAGEQLLAVVAVAQAHAALTIGDAALEYRPLPYLDI